MVHLCGSMQKSIYICNMILSILIPTYNHDCTKLVRDLSEQMPQEAEIIVGDDGSTDATVRQTLQEIDGMPQCRLWIAPCNLGRSAIRNKLAQMAQGEWLVFIDSDAEVDQTNYIDKYLQNRTADIVVGGTSSPRVCPSPSVSLRYRYESTFWKRHTANQRNLHPYASFTAFNFMIRREVFMKIGFDESCSKYGHEDTLLGQELKRKGVSIMHIDNPLIHCGLESNQVYLRKTEESLSALLELADKLADTSQLLKVHGKIRRLHLATPVMLFHRMFGPAIKRNLCSQHPNLHLFNIYKLGAYTCMAGRKPET